ncbi:MAG: SCO family protein [Candidatus Methylomirabilales bacterium]
MVSLWTIAQPIVESTPKRDEQMEWRMIFWEKLSLAACPAWFTVLVLGALLHACSGEPQFRGTALDPPRDSLDFTLQDQFGKPVSLRTLRGGVVVLTFLYTSCPDVCPLITGKLRETHELIGDAASRLTILAVTVDPEQDTVRRVYEYSQQMDMLDKWHFLVGGMPDLQPIWDYYWVGKVWKDETGNVYHQAPVHLIDQEGKVHVVYGSTFRPAELVHDIEVLLGR